MKNIRLRKLLAVMMAAICGLGMHAYDQLLVVGDATWGGWSLDRTSVMVPSETNPDQFTYTGYLQADKEFKFLTEAKWDKTEFRNASPTGYINGEGRLQLNGDDNKFMVAESANYTIVCNLADLTVSVTKAGYQQAPVYHNVLYLVGSATPGGWTLSQSVALAQSAGNPFRFSGKAMLTADGTFKIATNCYGDYAEQKFYFRDNNDAGKISENGDGDRQWSVDNDGCYLVTVDISDMTIDMAPAQPDEVVESRLCWYEPADARQDEEITLFFNASKGNAALKGYDGEVWITSGIITDDNDDLSGLVHMIGPDGTTPRNQYTMVRSEKNPDIYSIRLKPETYYVAGSDTRIRMLGMKFASADGSIEAADNDGGIIYVPFRSNTGVMWYRPSKASLDEPITVHFDATAGNGALAGYGKGVYVHTGVITDESTSDSDWKHTSGWLDNDARYQMTRSMVNPDQYTLTFTPSVFYGLEEGENVRKLAFVARNADASKMGKTSAESDILIDFKNGSHEADRVALGAVTGWESNGSTLTVSAENGTLQLTVYAPEIIKVITRINGDDTPERRSISVCATPEGEFTVDDEAQRLVMHTASLMVTVDKSTCKVAFCNPAGNVVLSEKDGLDNSALPRMASFEGMGDTAFYGGGYNGQRINLDGQTLVMNNTQTGGWECTWGAPHNICIPFVVSTSGYGLLFDDHYRNARISPSSAGTTYSSGSPTPVAYYYVGSSDGSMASVMENYTLLTGRQELPPYWALGYMTSRYGYHSRTEAENVIASVKKAQLPVDAIVFDLYWQGEGNSGMGNLDWYAPNWNNPGEMMSNFSNMGVKTICITEPFFTSASSNYTVLKERGFFADDDVSGMEWLGASPVGLIDASNPDAMDWMWQFYKARTAEGVAGWWLDLGEPERHDADSHHMGGTVGQIHNEFGDLWTSSVYRGFKADFPDVRPFIMPRAGTAGMQRYSTFPWTGDIKRSWQGLQAQIPALLSAGMSGVGYMGNDVGGFSASSTDSRLYLRWVEMSVFSPMMRTHSTHNPEPYLDCYADVLPDVRNCLNIRYSYLPYTYSIAWENATKGTPLARPLNFHDRQGEAPSVADCTDEYLWGRDILVAPVLDDATSRKVTFPQGAWFDLNNLTDVYAGGSTVSYDAPMGTLPHFGRAGSFITRFSQTDFTNTSDIDNTRLTVLYLPGASGRVATATMFDDDRTSTGTIERNDYLTVTFVGQQVEGGHEIRVINSGGYPDMPVERQYTFVVPKAGSAVSSITANDHTPFNRVDSAEKLESADDAAYFVDTDNTLYIKATIPASEAESAITITGGNLALESTMGGNEMHLSYSNATGCFSYSAPTAKSAMLTISNLTGVQVAEISGLVADGTVHQVASPELAAGVYVSTLSCFPFSGMPFSKSVKTLMR